MQFCNLHYITLTSKHTYLNNTLHKNICVCNDITIFVYLQYTIHDFVLYPLRKIFSSPVLYYSQISDVINLHCWHNISNLLKISAYGHNHTQSHIWKDPYKFTINKMQSYKHKLCIL